MARGGVDWGEGLTRDALEGADDALFRLSRGLGRVRLQMGLALAALGRGHRELGFRTLDAYAQERLHRSGRWAGDLRSAAARIASLPRIFAALWAGELSWCMAELLSRHATADDEAELLEATAGMTVRAAADALRERGGAEKEEERRHVTLQLAMPSEDAELVQRARWLIEAMEGVGATEWFELLIAEGSGSLLEIAQDDPSWELSPEDVAAAQRRWLAARRQAEEERAQQEERAAPRLPIGGAAPVEAGDAPELEPLPHTPEALDAALRSGRIGSSVAQLVARVARPATVAAWLERAERRTYKHLREEVEAVELSVRLFGAEGPLRPPEDDALEDVWQVERDTLSGASLRALIGRLATAPHAEAVVAVVSGIEAARRAGAGEGATVCDPGASSASQGVDAFRSASSDGPQMFGSHERRLEVTGGDATPERADRTVAPERPQMFGCDDHRRVEVASDDAALGRADRAAAPEAPEMFRCDDHRRVDVASDDATLERTDRTVTPEAPQMFGCDEHRRVEAAGSADGSDVRAASGRRRFGHTTLRVRCPEDVALHFRQLEVSYERAGLPGSFLRFAATAFFHVALPQIAEERKYHGIHVRDRMRCTSPVCNSRNVTCHHVRYRAHRGGDEPENLTSPCDFCHLEGEHEGRLRIRGEAPNLRWEIGRTPIVIVEGRERRDMRARDSEAADRFERSDRSSAV